METDAEAESTIDSETDSVTTDSDDTEDRRIKTVFRPGWGAKPPTYVEPQILPVSHVLFTWTGGEDCTNAQECIDRVRALQKKDMDERGLPDIQHNYLLGGDGVVYEGRGHLAKATKDPFYQFLDGQSIDLAFIGDYSNTNPTILMMDMSINFIEKLMNQNLVVRGYKIHWRGQEIEDKFYRDETPVTDEPSEDAHLEAGQNGGPDAAK